MNKILIITSKKDVHVDYILSKCIDFGIDEDCIRLNTEDFADNVKASFDGRRFTVKLKDSERIFSSEDIYTVWYRRPQPMYLGAYDDKGVEKFIRQQYNVFMNGLYYCTHDSALWINDLGKALLAKNKLYQLQVANEVEFNIPKLIVSNNYEDIERFCNETSVVCNKSLDLPRYSINGTEYAYMTRMVKDKNEISDHRAELEVCPVLFEEFIDKLYDIRVVIFGKHMFAFEIHSQDENLATIDMRGIDPCRLIHRSHILPQEIKNKIFAFMQRQGLVFSSMDLLLTREGKYYFIENNQNGQWLWLENLTDVDMSSDFINFMLKHE